MKPFRGILAVAVLGMLATVGTGCSSSVTSPIVKGSDYAKTKQQWGGPVLVPTELPANTEVNSVQYLDRVKKFEVDMNKLYLLESTAKEATITQLSHDQHEGETISDTIKRVQQLKGKVVGHTNEIDQIEEEKIGGKTGYWYEILTDEGKSQVVEFVQDGLQVYLRAKENSDLSKEELLRTANSFKLDK